MTSTPIPAFDIDDLITRQAIDIHFQPIVSVRRQAIVGVEALSRGINGAGELIPPLALFDAAESRELALELDRVCRSAAVEHFARLLPANPELILFMNVHAASLDMEAEDADSIVGLARSRHIDPRNVAIEILESEWEDTDRLRSAVVRLHDIGFLVVLDDVGAGHSNLDRITYG